MPTRPTFSLYDRLLDGQLVARLTDWRSRGTSYDDISRMLHDLDVLASRTTVKRWCDDNGIS